MEIDKSINNYFEKLLVDEGYNIFKSSFNNSIRGFQKKFTDDIGIKYFITIYHYNHGRQISTCNEYEDSYIVEVQFRYDEDSKDNVIDVTFSGNFLHNKYREPTSLKDAEEHIEKYWKTMNYEYYEKFI